MGVEALQFQNAKTTDTSILRSTSNFIPPLQKADCVTGQEEFIKQENHMFLNKRKVCIYMFSIPVVGDRIICIDYMLCFCPNFIGRKCKRCGECEGCKRKDCGEG